MSDNVCEILEKSHNPYFNRWFSAIEFTTVFFKVFNEVTILILIDGFLQLTEKYRYKVSCICHNPYFNRWFSAISTRAEYAEMYSSHNPYFNRWFSAI